MSALIILVNADPRALRHTEALLSEQGYLVAALPSFAEARWLLDSVMPDLLIADLHLECYNGLQLAIRGHQDHPDLPVIITFTHDDPIAEAEATRYGASFIVAPLENSEFLPLVRAAIERRRSLPRSTRRWSRRPMARVVEVNAARARAQIVDLSYGGVRLAFSEARQVPETFLIALPTGGVSVVAHRVWTARSEADDQFCCGAELADTSTSEWRLFVDSLQNQAAS